MIRRTDRVIGGEHLRQDPAEVTLGRNKDGTPTVIITGGQSWRRAKGVAFFGVHALLDLRSLIDEAIEAIDEEASS